MNPRRKKAFRIVLTILISIVSLWCLLTLSGFHFCSRTIPLTLVWLLILLIGAVIRIAVTDRAAIITVSIVIPLILVLYIPIVWFFVSFTRGTETTVQTLSFPGHDQEVMGYFHQGSWGGTPYQTYYIGQSYFGGVLYTVDTDTTIGFEYQYAEEVEELIVLPTGIQGKDLVLVWKGQHMLIDAEREVCYDLKYK
jgi:hypothetical protein